MRGSRDCTRVRVIFNGVLSEISAMFCFVLFCSLLKTNFTTSCTSCWISTVGTKVPVTISQPSPNPEHTTQSRITASLSPNLHVSYSTRGNVEDNSTCSARPGCGETCMCVSSFGFSSWIDVNVCTKGIIINPPNVRNYFTSSTVT